MALLFVKWYRGFFVGYREQSWTLYTYMCFCVMFINPQNRT